jgi:phytoene desaturase
MSGKRVIVIGAGPGGLAAAGILAHRGFDVTVLEKRDRVGGRSAELTVGDYSFDTGPTFLHQKFCLDEVFAEMDRDPADYLEFVKLDPMTRLTWGDGSSLETSCDEEAMARNIAAVFPGEEEGFRRFMADQGPKLRAIYPCLQKPYHKVSSFLRKELLRAVPYVATTRSVVDELENYFGDDRLKLAFTFQSKYLGMSPWKCPALFTILSYTEYKFGIYHTQGGLCRISHALAKAAEECGAEIRLDAPVSSLEFEGRNVSEVRLESGEVLKCDHAVMNADYAYAMANLMNGRSKSDAELRGKKFSCSTYMLYLGLDTLYEDEPHHHVMFADDYRRNVEEVGGEKTISDDMSVYVRNSSVTDPNVAPKGHSQLYVLVPTINTREGADWGEVGPQLRDKVLDRIQRKTGMKDLRDHIVAEAEITPAGWRDAGNVFLGATFNLAHTIDQMLYLRPHNRLRGYENLYLVGGGTHPGSGLPTIFESARISSNMLCDGIGLNYEPADLSSAYLASGA